LCHEVVVPFYLAALYPAAAMMAPCHVHYVMKLSFLSVCLLPLHPVAAMMALTPCTLHLSATTVLFKMLAMEPVSHELHGRRARALATRFLGEQPKLG